MNTNDDDLLLPMRELPVPAALDALVFERACEALETAQERPAPMPVPRTEALVYAAGLTAYLAVLARALHSVAQHAIRVLGG